MLLMGAGGAMSLMARGAGPAPTVPPGAGKLGCTKCIINERPTAADVVPGKDGAYKWFSGQWYAKPPSLDHYSTEDGVLVLKQGGDLVSTPRDFSAGKLPLLPGADGFYVEFEVRLSGQDPDYFPAVWLMPAEHSGKQQDQYRELFPNDPPGYERWMEFDIDEGGFGPGLTGTVHNWYGIWGKDGGYKHQQNPNNVSKLALDRSGKHIFGGSYDPAKRQVTWWVDGVEQMSAAAPYVPEVAARQHYYLILSAQSHGKDKPYRMYISGVRAFVPPTSAVPAVP
jgi:hypothetical protein